MLIANESATRKAVFLYEDLNDDDYINQNEWEKQIVEKHISILVMHDIQNYHTFPTSYRKLDGTIIQHLFLYIQLYLYN